MTISSTNRKAGPYLGNGTIVTFPFSFKVFKKEDLAIIYADEHGIEQLMLLESDYTVQLNTEQETTPGGTVTLIHAPATGARVTITSTLEYMQPVKITNQGGFYPQIINDALDRLTIFVQQLSEQVERSIKVKITSNKDPDELVASLEDNAALAKQSAADAKESERIATQSAEELKGYRAGKQPSFQEAYCNEIGGYPKGAVLLGADHITHWQNMVDSNRTNPDSANAHGWVLVNIKTPTINIVKFESSGTYIPSPGTQFIIVEGIGGGGAGGGASVTTAGYTSVGSGGGAGGYCKSRIEYSEFGSIIDVVVGKGGIGVVGTVGGLGGDTVFGEFFTASGGSGGLKAGQANSSFSVHGTSGGDAFGGNILNITGETGNNAFATIPGYTLAGNGASCPLGSGGRMANGTTGGKGIGYGAGGGGSYVSGGPIGAYAGGNGASGVVIVTEYILS